MNLPILAKRDTMLSYMPHAGMFIKAYLEKRCPQAQARVFPSQTYRTCWDIYILHAAGGRVEAHASYRYGDNIAEFCKAALEAAGYTERNDEETGKRYYAARR